MKTLLLMMKKDNNSTLFCHRNIFYDLCVVRYLTAQQGSHFGLYAELLFLPELPNFMQYCTWHHVHVVCASSAHRPRIICTSSACHPHIVCVSSAHAHMLSAPGHVICRLSAGHLHHSSWSPWA